MKTLGWRRAAKGHPAEHLFYLEASLPRLQARFSIPGGETPAAKTHFDPFGWETEATDGPGARART
jgi:hypothetical protein